MNKKWLIILLLFLCFFPNIKAIPNVNLTNFTNITCGANVGCESQFNAEFSRRVCVNHLNISLDKWIVNGKIGDIYLTNIGLYQKSGNSWIWLNTNQRTCWNAGNYTFKINGTKDGKSDAKWSIPTLDIDPYWYGLPLGEELQEGWSIHIWNEVDDYYINNSDDVQMSNHHDEIWANNYHEIKIRKGSTWYDYNLSDLGLSWIVNTDNLNYVNYTGTTLINIDGTNVNFTLIYFLYSNESFIHIIPKFKNLGSDQLEIKYIWNLRDIQIHNTTEGDSIILDTGKFMLNETIDITFSNLTTKEVFLHDENSGENLWFSWEDIPYTYQIVSDESSYNANNILTVSIGNISQNEIATTEFKWIDAICSWSCNYLTPTVQQNISEGEAYSHTGSITFSGTCVTTGRNYSAEYQDLGNWYLITGTRNLTTPNTNPQLLFPCFLGTCGPFSWTVIGNLNGTYSTRDVCYFNSQLQQIGGPVINVTASIDPICADYYPVTSSITLSANNNSCFNITGNNIVFNCANYILNSNNTDNYTIIAKDITNLTIKNCKFQGMRRAINLQNINYSLLDNNTFYNLTDKSSKHVFVIGINMTNVDHTLVNRSNFTILETNPSTTNFCYNGYLYGIYLRDSENTSIVGSIFNKIIGVKQGFFEESSCSDTSRPQIGESISLYNSSNNIIFNSNLSSGYYSIYMDSNSNQFNISSNNLSNFSAYGVYNYGGDNGIISNCYFSKMTSISIYLLGNSQYNNISNNLFDNCEKVINDNYVYTRINNNIIKNIYSTSDYSYAIEFGGFTLEFNNNTLYNITYTKGNTSVAMYSQYAINITNSNISNVTNGILFGTQSENSYIINSTLNASNYSVRVPTGITGINLINVTWNKSKALVEGTSTLYNYYSLTLNVTDQNRLPINNATINLKDTYGNQVNETTGANGLSSTRIMLEFNQTNTSITYVTPYNITTFKLYYDLNTTLFNTSFATSYNIILNWSNCWVYNETRHWLFIPAGCRLLRSDSAIF